MSQKHYDPYERFWPLDKQLSLPNETKSCAVCDGKTWVYCSGNSELGCQDVKLEHIHSCPACQL